MYFSAKARNFHTGHERFENLDNWDEVLTFLYQWTMRGHRTFEVTAFNENGKLKTKTYRTMMDGAMTQVKIFGAGCTLKGFAWEQN